MSVSPRSTLRWLGLALATATAVPAVLVAQSAPAAAQQGEEIQIETFYQELQDHGRWFEHPRYGHVWAPDVDDENWRPYSRGSWVHTEEHGWYWESDEPFGWAVYHYGRWFRDEADGWIWVPGTEWGPAWVAWRHGEEDVGWAPLPPEAEWHGGNISLASSFYDNPRFSAAWCFVPVALLTSGRVWTHFHSVRRNAHYFDRTRFVPYQRGSGRGFYNSGFDRRRWESVTGRRVVSRNIVTVNRPFWDGGRGGRSSGDIQVYRPRVTGLPRTDGRPGYNPPNERRAWPERRPDNWNDRGRDGGRPGGSWGRDGGRDGGRDADRGRDGGRFGGIPDERQGGPGRDTGGGQGGGSGGGGRG